MEKHDSNQNSNFRLLKLFKIQIFTFKDGQIIKFDKIRNPELHEKNQNSKLLNYDKIEFMTILKGLSRFGIL